MRSAFRSALVALLAVLALGAVAASGASAHEYFIEGKSMKELGIKEEAFTSKASTNVVLNVTGFGLEVSCASAKGKGTLDQGGTGIATLSLTECTTGKPVGCKVVEPIVFTSFNADLVEFAGALSEEFSPMSSIIKWQGCSLEESELWGEITGKMKSEADKETQEVVFGATTGSEFGFEGKKASLRFTDTLQLSGANSGKKWSARK